MLPTFGETSPTILKHFISLANSEPERAKMKTGIIYSACMSISTRGGDSRGQGEGIRLNGRRLTPVGGGSPVRHTISP